MPKIQLILFVIGCHTLTACVSQSAPTPPPLAMTRNQNGLEESKALGYLGEQYEKAERYEDALTKTRQAIFKAQEPHALAWLIRWQWQLGRIFKAQGKMNQAIAAYQQAQQNLVPEKTFRWKMKCQVPGKPSLYKKLRPLFFQLADMFLQRATIENEPTKKQEDLRQARNTIEQLKRADVEQYFGDCVTAFHNKSKGLDDIIDAHTAVIYPILLNDRLELLVRFLDEFATIQRFQVPVGIVQIRDEVAQFREQLEAGYDDRESTQFKAHAQQLYAWLIKPLHPLLTQHAINTLVFVPEGPLLTFPIAALHDGEQFLIENFAVAITPGLSLTDPKSGTLTASHTPVLFGAITKATQDYSELPYAQYEIEALGRLYQNATLLQDERFTQAELTKALNNQDYSVVHLISHAEFSDHLEQSFILTFDGKLTLEQLKSLIQPTKRRQTPIELLTLSACNTAEGDNEWAALGLSGIALKAGARSTLATLWKAHDKTTYLLITRFYRALITEKLSKARALQAAQIQIIDSIYHHPFYWAPLILIGNWM